MLQAEAARLATSLAGEIVRQNLNAQDEERLRLRLRRAGREDLVIGAGEIARRYARAVFGLSEGAKAHADLLEELRTLTAEIAGNAELTRVLMTPLHPRAERKAVLRELAQKLGASTEVRVTSELLVDENRLSLLPAICERAAGAGRRRSRPRRRARRLRATARQGRAGTHPGGARAPRQRRHRHRVRRRPRR